MANMIGATELTLSKMDGAQATLLPSMPGLDFSLADVD
jgi:hypothetical protein